MERAPKTKYKLVVDNEHDAKWVKEKTDTGVVRHQVVTGPKGGESITNSDGNKVYIKTIPTVTEVCSEDSHGQPANKECHYGFGNTNKDKKELEKQ